MNSSHFNYEPETVIIGGLSISLLSLVIKVSGGRECNKYDISFQISSFWDPFSRLLL